ncbi:NACHT domain-containing protein [Streptomyces sp. NPDC004435]|uniref:NACHT domain-containing protein n=1 Tax=Streptomyces sp. NPDC004435 TaxID=3364701 RepID=UPI0036AE2D7C
MNTARPGALGGASNEAGASHRSGIAALIAVYGLLEEGVPWLRSDAVPVKLRMEADLHVDDIVVDLADGTTAFIQAKLSPTPAAFNATVDQWCRAVASRECREGDELLFVVTRTDGPLTRTAQALTTHQSGASLTTPAVRRLDALRNLAAGHGLDHAGTEQLLAAAKVIALDARDNGPDEALGAACLNAAVVTAGHGRTAFRAMKAAARSQAEQRTASHVTQWRTWLADAMLPLVADEAGTRAARLQARDQALTQYRENWAAGQDTLPLADLGRGLTSMTVPGAAGHLQAKTPGQGPGRSGLVDTVRRQGRLFLVGAPGSGKTVASRLLAAHWAAHPYAPVPVWLRMKDLVPLLPQTGPYLLQPADLVHAAVGLSSPLLAAALVSQIDAGEALIVLDALDEVHERQDAVVEAVATLINQLPADCDVVVTSRYSSQQGARRLGLPLYELRPPNDLSSTLDHLLDTVAERAVHSSDQPHSREALRRRVERSRRAEPDLWNVPLLATLMTLLIAERPDAAVAGNRARLLTEVVDSSVRGWEMRRSAKTLPDTDPQLTADILTDCFDDIAHAINPSGSATWDTAHRAVVSRLQQHWGKPPGTAATMARHALEYWDATAGVFITDTHQGNLTARTRLFAEIGDARWATRHPDHMTEWMQNTFADPERRETARLAASLSPHAADALIRQALRTGGSALDLVNEALTDGTGFDDNALHEYRDAQLARLQTLQPRYPKATEDDGVLHLSAEGSPRAELAARLAEEDLDATQTQQLIETAETLGPEQKAVITALRAQRQATRRGSAPTESELDTIEAGLAAAATTTSARDPGIAGTDSLARFAVEHVLAARPSILPHLIATTHHVTVDTFEWLETELSQRGHHGALATLLTEVSGNILATFKDSYKKMAVPFEFLAALNTTGTQLTPAQAWHLNEAAALTAALRMKDRPMNVVADAVTHHAELTQALFSLIAEASGLDRALAGSQLRSLRDELPQNPDWGLLYLPSTRTPTPQLHLESIDADLVIDTLNTNNPWLAYLALLLTAATVTPPPDLAERALAALPSLTAFDRMNTAALLAHRWPGLALPADDPLVRAGAARVTAATLSHSRRHREAQHLLADPDLLVRHTAAQELDGPSPGDRTVLVTALQSPAQQWTCRFCGATGPADADTCPRNHPRPTPRLP